MRRLWIRSSFAYHHPSFPKLIFRVGSIAQNHAFGIRSTACSAPPLPCPSPLAEEGTYRCGIRGNVRYHVFTNSLSFCARQYQGSTLPVHHSRGVRPSWPETVRLQLEPDG